MTIMTRAGEWGVGGGLDEMHTAVQQMLSLVRGCQHELACRSGWRGRGRKSKSKQYQIVFSPGTGPLSPVGTQKVKHCQTPLLGYIMGLDILLRPPIVHTAFPLAKGKGNSLLVASLSLHKVSGSCTLETITAHAIISQCHLL